MAGAWPSNAATHARAWQWLNGQEADVALIQEAALQEDTAACWHSVVWSPKYGHNWGSAVLTRDTAYTLWQPGAANPWLSEVGGAACVAEPDSPDGLWLVSVHSSAGAWTQKDLHSLPALGGVPRCSVDGAELWEIEVVAHELQAVLRDRPFVMGGDLNSALAFDTHYGGKENEVLFANLTAAGYVDLRPRHAPEEQQTYFKARCRPYQLDHLFADADNEPRVTSWEVLTEVAAELGLSDHAPILVTLDLEDRKRQVLGSAHD